MEVTSSTSSRRYCARRKLVSVEPAAFGMCVKMSSSSTWGLAPGFVDPPRARVAVVADDFGFIEQAQAAGHELQPTRTSFVSHLPRELPRGARSRVAVAR